MASLFDVRHAGQHYQPGNAMVRGYCDTCGGESVFGVVALYDPPSYEINVSFTKWLRCSTCLTGAVENDGLMSQPVKPLRVPLGLPADEAAIWDEARGCLAVGANTAAVMLCRKLLFHLAVANGLPAKNGRDRAPGFMECVEHLEAEGVITSRMRPWVDRIKDVGNEVNHELQPISAEAALDVAKFTEQLLKLAHEMDALMAQGNTSATPALPGSRS